MARTTRLSSRLAERSKARHKPGVVLPAVQEGMLKDFGLDEDRRWDIVHPSELSHQPTIEHPAKGFCPRAVYMRITEGPLPAEKFDFVRENIFAEGNSIHDKWQARLRRYTDLWGDWVCIICGTRSLASTHPVPGTCCYVNGMARSHIWKYIEVNLDAEAEALMCGHADGAFGNTLVEFKSVGVGTVRIESPTLHKKHTMAGGDIDLTGLWKDIARPFKTHLNQGDIYLWICAQRGLPFNQIAYVYESKWNQLTKEFVIPYDESRSLFLVDQSRSVMYAVEHKTEPACKLPGECKECKPYDERRAAGPKKRTVQIRAD